MKSCCHGNRDYLMNIFTQLFSGIEVNTFTSDSLHFIKELLFKTQYYKNHIFLAFSRQKFLVTMATNKNFKWVFILFWLVLEGLYVCEIWCFCQKINDFFTNPLDYEASMADCHGKWRHLLSDTWTTPVLAAVPKLTITGHPVLSWY